jgi:hypothetical protein
MEARAKRCDNTIDEGMKTVYLNSKYHGKNKISFETVKCIFKKY